DPFVLFAAITRIAAGPSGALPGASVDVIAAQQALTVVPVSANLPSVVSGSPVSFSSTPQTFTVTGRDPDGYIDISHVYFLVNAGASTAANTCHGFYHPDTNSLYLYNDALSSVSGP